MTLSNQNQTKPKTGSKPVCLPELNPNPSSYFFSTLNPSSAFLTHFCRSGAAPLTLSSSLQIEDGHAHRCRYAVAGSASRVRDWANEMAQYRKPAGDTRHRICPSLAAAVQQRPGRKINALRNSEGPRQKSAHLLPFVICLMNVAHPERVNT